MSSLIGVQGNIDDIFRCVDFYAKVSHVGMRTPEDLRKEFMQRYLASYKESLENNEDDNEFASHGVYVEDLEVTADNSDNEVNYVSHGIYVEDISTEDYFKAENGSVSVEYVNHGVYVEDINISVSVEDGSDAKESSWGDEVEDDSEWGEDDDSSDDSYSENTWGNEDDEEMISESDWRSSSESEKLDWGDDSDNGDEEEMISESDWNREGSNFEDSKGEINTSVKEVHSNPIKDEKTVTYNEEVKEPCVSYSSVREFVKKNKGCSKSDILKYFSVKDLQKTLMSAKVVSRKGKFYTV